MKPPSLFKLNLGGDKKASLNSDMSTSNSTPFNFLEPYQPLIQPWNDSYKFPKPFDFIKEVVKIDKSFKKKKVYKKFMHHEDEDYEENNLSFGKENKIKNGPGPSFKISFVKEVDKFNAQLKLSKFYKPQYDKAAPPPDLFPTEQQTTLSNQDSNAPPPPQ